MPINFPSSPTLNQTYAFGQKTWVWNGYAWDLQLANANSVIVLTQAAYNQANASFIHANSAFNAANNALDTWVRGQANAAFVQANAAFAQSNIALTQANSAFLAANGTAIAANTPSHVANSAAIYANGAFTLANGTAIAANTPSHVANSAAIYANGAFAAANVADAKAVTAGSYANSAFIIANTPSHVANSASSYANSAFIHANAAFNAANTAGITYTASTSAPGSPSIGDQWYDTDTDILYEYLNDGTSSYWVDTISPVIGGSASSNASGGGTDQYARNTANASFIHANAAFNAANVGGPYSLSGTTTGNTELELFVGGVAGSRINVSTNTTVTYDVTITARRTDVTGFSAGFNLKGVVDNFSGTVADVGLLYENIIARDDVNYLVDARADDTNNAIGIHVTGVAGHTIKWAAKVTTVEVQQ